MNIINKKSLAEVVANELDITKKSAAVAVDAIFNEIATTLENGGKVEISGFGKFEVKQREEREGVNPKTKERITIAASKSPVFKPSKLLKEAVK
ncbi:MAG: HU family DNA-binding protein [Erysipelotrichaceae bacterium]|nr:HU family DNA-binding protein [Erysipelotrichaceae bacterium]MBR3693050.1 HU family DNA-binding protein [Erysipelotrichales bacterium]